MALSGQHVDRCVCHDVTFAELLEYARKTGATLGQLAERTGCSTGCGLCKPYIAKALETGSAQLPVDLTNH